MVMPLIYSPKNANSIIWDRLIGYQGLIKYEVNWIFLMNYELDLNEKIVVGLTSSNKDSISH